MGTKSPKRIINGSKQRKGAGSPNVNPKVIKDDKKQERPKPPLKRPAPKVPTLRDKIEQFQRPQKERDMRKGFLSASKGRGKGRRG